LGHILYLEYISYKVSCTLKTHSLTQQLIILLRFLSVSLLLQKRTA